LPDLIRLSHGAALTPPRRRTSGNTDAIRREAALRPPGSPDRDRSHELLESHGVTVSGIEDDSTQLERSLNTTLVRPEVRECFGEDLIFDLRGLLVEKVGSDLHHDVAHGLLDGAAFQTTEAIYVWRITLRVCVLAAATLATHDATDNRGASDG